MGATIYLGAGAKAEYPFTRLDDGTTIELGQGSAPVGDTGSLCGKALSRETVSTIGEQGQSNYAFQPMEREAFVELITADQPDAPPYFTYDAVLNTKERPTLDEALARELKPLSLEGVLALQEGGAQVLDTREPTEFAPGHLKGSVNIGLDGRFATWAGTILIGEEPVVIVADPGRERETALRLGRIDFDQVVGYLEKGMLSLDHRSELTEATDRVSPRLAAERLESADAPMLIDVGRRVSTRQNGSSGASTFRSTGSDTGIRPRATALLL